MSLEELDLRIPKEALKDPALAKEFALLDQILSENPLEGYNNPELSWLGAKIHKKQMEFHAIDAGPLGIKLLLASNRSGKTVGGVVDDIIQLVDEALLPDHLKPFKKWHGPVTIWVGAPKNENHFNNTIPLFRRFLPKAALKDGKWKGTFKSQPNPRLELANGSEVAFKTYDQDLDAWAGAEVHRIHWDEEPNGENSRELRTEARYRLVSTEGDEQVTMTPVLGAYSWVNDEVWERREESGIFAMKMKIWDNPWNSKSVVEKIVKEAKAEGEEVYRTRIEAEFVHLGGLFFPEFREDLHVIAEIPPEAVGGRDVVVSIDPGRQRSGVTWTAFDNDNGAVVFDEFFPGESEVVQVAEEIKRRNDYWGIEPRYVIDRAASAGSAIDADSVLAAYMREEIYAERGQSDRAVGILEMKKRLQNKTKDKPDPTLQFTRKCPETIRQVERYARDPKSKDEWAAVPQSGRTRWDLVDSCRYGVMQRTWHVPPASEQPKRFSTATYQAPYADEPFAQDVAPLGSFS